MAVIIGTLLFHLAPIVVLFDSSSTHSFISKPFVDRIGVPVDDLRYDLVVSPHAGIVLTTEVCMRSIAVVIEWCITFTNVTVLSMREFDVIFSMDWVTMH